MKKNYWCCILLFISLCTNGYLLRYNVSFNFTLSFNIMKDIITIISLIIASYVGLQGLHTWRKNLAGTEMHQKAKDFLIDLYQYRDRLYDYRHPAIRLGEYPMDNGLPPNAIGRNKYNDMYFVYTNRLRYLREYTAKLYIQKLECRVLFGVNLEQKYDFLFKIENEITNEIMVYIENMDNENRNEVDDGIVHDTMKEDDPIRKKVNDIIEQIEKALIPYLIKC